MNLPIPVPSQTGGPQYALDEQSCFQQIDSHNHTPGQGIAIPLNALSINQNLDMSALSVTNLKSISFLNQAISPGSSSLYMLGNDLYWTDGSGAFNVQITSGNSVAVSGAVGFSGLPSGTASAAYLSLTGTFRFQSATNTGATLDVGPIKLRNTTVSSNAVTLTPPNPLPSNYSLTLPNALPASDSFVVSDNSGNLSFQSTSFVLPAGVMMMYGGTAAPTGWLFCNGSIVSQATYSALFAVVGTSFNIGSEGAGNFRLPDMRRRVPMGAGGAGSGTIGNSIGNAGGEENHTLVSNELASHTHTGSNQYVRVGTNFGNTVHLECLGVPAWTRNAWVGGSGGTSGVTVTNGVYLQGASDDFAQKLPNGASGHNTIQPSLVVNYIIKY